MPRSFLSISLLLVLASASHAQRNFGFDNRKASGQPYLKAEETVRRFEVAPGWEAKLVAAEPDVINPVAFTFDEKGRIWVLECFEYPKRTPKGKKPRDRIKIIEETPQGPKVTIWAEGKDLPIGWDIATGLEVGHGGVFLGAPPYLFFLSDPGNTGRCTKQEILLKGFGSQDTHETLNTFQWGPDGKLYGLHGVFTHSEVTPVADAPGSPVRMNAAVWTYDVRSKKFAIFAEGTSNPWGMDFDARGNCFVTCCVIPHLFHIVPGGIYKRQAGASMNPYAYGYLNEICDHVHHKESGWAHAGCLVLDGDHVPEAYRGSVLMGSIHGNSIKRDVLRPNGSSFIASCAKDFLVSGDKNFRPINLRWGPDGSIYVIDWHDQNPCHQAAPDTWDYDHGRIYKLTPTPPFSRDATRSATSPPDLGKKSNRVLVELLKNDNPYVYRTALRLLHERRRRDEAVVDKEVKDSFGYVEKKPLFSLRMLWAGYPSKAIIGSMISGYDTEPSLRSWSVRMAGEHGDLRGATLLTLAKTDRSPSFRVELASLIARKKKHDPFDLLTAIFLYCTSEEKDDQLSFMMWLAFEPLLLTERDAVLETLRNSPRAAMSDQLIPRVMRRLVATRKPDDLDACLLFLKDAKDSTVRTKALGGLLTAFNERETQAPARWKDFYGTLLKDGDRRVHDLARKLAVHFRDRDAITQAVKIAGDGSKSVADRSDALRAIALLHPSEALPTLRLLMVEEKNAELRTEALRALAGYDTPGLATTILLGWRTYPQNIRTEAVNLLAGRKTWARELLVAVGNKQIPRGDLSENTILKMRAFKDRELDQLIEKHWGRLRDTPKELAALIDKMRSQVREGTGFARRGKVVFENQCAKCHKFAGLGHEVGPALDGAIRDLDGLLINVIDPNRVVGLPYYIRSAELKNGRIETGLLVAEDEQAITLKGENGVLKTIAKKDIEGKVMVHEKSMMPEGLASNMTAQDFRDLYRYLLGYADKK